MKESRIISQQPFTINEAIIADYRRSVIEELKSLGATDSDIDLVDDATIINAIKANKYPNEVAWTILQ